MAIKYQDYYQILGVERTATPAALKQAFRDLARIYHPDVAKDKVAGEARFKEINEAYEVLGDPEKRRRYDELGGRWKEAPEVGARTGRASMPEGPEVHFGGTGFSDFFESFFGGGRGAFGGQPGGRVPDFDGAEAYHHEGADLEADLLVTLEEALKGVTKTVTLRRREGGGVAERTNTYQVKIPPGVREGKRIRLVGQGGAGQGEADAGDLYLRVRLARHPDFTVKEADLFCDLELAPWEAVLGVRTEIATLESQVSLKVEPGSQGGTKLRLRSLGLLNDDGSRGDIYVTLRLRTPSAVSPAEEALWRNLAKGSAFRARKPS